MPTFVLLVRGQEVDRLQGANGDRLRQLIDLHFQTPQKKKSGGDKTATPGEREWLHSNVVRFVDQVKMYEDEVNKMLALSLIPVDAIKEKSMVGGKLNASSQAYHLMEWFKNEFFGWVNNPKCDSCQKENTTKLLETTVCTSNEAALGGGKTEVYECDDCKNKTRFVRYNNPATLLETRLINATTY